MNVFISYSQKDGDLALQLSHLLRQEGLNVWNGSEMIPGANWALEMGRALEDADAMVLLLTQNTAASPYMSFDLEYALGNVKFDGRVIPVVSSDVSQQGVPWVLGLRAFQSIIIPDTGLDNSIAQKIAHALNTAPHEPREKVFA